MKREQVLPHVMADMAARIAKGADEYGEPLTTNNERDALVDAYEEALDLALYLKQALMERDGMGILQQMNLRAAKHAKEQLMTRGEWEAITRHAGVVDTIVGAPESWAGPDWSQAPKWAMWWAKDFDVAEAVWYRHKPDAETTFWCVREVAGSKGYDFLRAPNFDYPGDWRESLRKRPE